MDDEKITYYPDEMVIDANLAKDSVYDSKLGILVFIFLGGAMIFIILAVYIIDFAELDNGNFEFQPINDILYKIFTIFIGGYLISIIFFKIFIFFHNRSKVRSPELLAARLSSFTPFSFFIPFIIFNLAKPFTLIGSSFIFGAIFIFYINMKAQGKKFDSS